jgi:hypothetical protein
MAKGKMTTVEERNGETWKGVELIEGQLIVLMVLRKFVVLPFTLADDHHAQWERQRDLRITTYI